MSETVVSFPWLTHREGEVGPRMALGRVSRPMDAILFLGEMERPVGVKIAIAQPGAQPQGAFCLRW